MADRPLPAYDGDEPYVFVSYSHEDDALVYPEIRWLQDQGFNIWYDEGISPGSTWRQELAESLKNSDLFLLFVTPASATSDNCLKEVNYALDEGRGILPIHLESTELPEGLKLSLSDRQAILKHELPDGEYREKVLSGVGGHIQRGQSFAPALPTIIPSNRTKPILIGAGLIAVAILTVGILNYLGPSEDASVPSGIPQESQTPATATETAVEEPPSIAVLPFEDMSAEQDQAYLGRGIAEELINGLTKLDGLRVASRTSSFYYAKQDIPITTIAENLKVRHILEGSIRKAGNRVRITMQLIDARSDTHLLSEAYDRDLDDLFSVQDEIAREVVKSLKIELGFGADQSIVDAGTESIEAFEEYRRALDAAYVTTAAGVIRAEQHARRAIELDPGYTWAYQILFTTIGIANLYGVYSDEQVKELKRSLLASWEEHNGENGSDLARYTRQLFAADIDRNVLLLEESLRYLILRRRVSAEAYVEILESVGEYQLARKFLLSTIGDAVQRNASNELLLGQLAADLDEVNAANEHFGRCLDIEPDAFFCRFYIVRTLLFLGEFDSAKSHLEYMKSKLGGENYFYLIANTIYQLVTGSRTVRSLDTKVREVRMALLEADGQFVPPFYKGTMFAAMCDIESALIEWEKSFEYGSFVIPGLRPHLTQNWVLSGKPPSCPPDEVLARPDVQAFLAKMGIDEEGHKIIRQRALSLAGVLEIEL